MRICAIYHVYADGAWQEPLAEYLDALEGFDGPLGFGVVGRRWREVVSALDEQLGREAWTLEALAFEGAEAVTLEAVRSLAICSYSRKGESAVLYAHTKGAVDNTPFRARWRRSMTDLVIRPWRANVRSLEETGADAIGCHWLTTEQYPPQFFTLTQPPFFGGNFWIARTSYLQGLPPVARAPRYAAESWLGLGDPKVVDLLPGWPADNLWVA